MNPTKQEIAAQRPKAREIISESSDQRSDGDIEFDIAILETNIATALAAASSELNVAGLADKIWELFRSYRADCGMPAVTEVEQLIYRAIRASSVSQWQPIDENTPKEIIGMEENGNIASMVWLARKDCWVSPDGAYGYEPRWWLPRSALPAPPVKEKPE